MYNRFKDIVPLLIGVTQGNYYSAHQRHTDIQLYYAIAFHEVINQVLQEITHVYYF